MGAPAVTRHTTSRQHYETTTSSYASPLLTSGRSRLQYWLPFEEIHPAPEHFLHSLQGAT